MNSRRAVAVTFVCIAAARLSGVQDGPRFLTGTHLVQISVLVRGKNGPVSNLGKDDFILTDKGKPQIVSVFSMTPVQPTPSALPENTFSNRTFSDAGNPASVTVVLLDRLNTLTSTGADAWEDNPTWLEAHALGYAKGQLVKFVKQMDPKDRVAIYSLADSLTVLSDFTGERDQLIQVLDRYRATSVTSREKVEPGATSTPGGPDFDAHINQQRQLLANLTNVSRAQITMAALSSIAAHLAAIPGRKNLVWLTADLPFPATSVVRILGRANVAVYPMDARGLLPKSVMAPRDDVSGGLWQVPRRTPEAQPRGQSTMEEIAADTGGRAFINTNDLTDAIHQAVEDAAVSYTLGFYPEAGAIDGKFHELKVRVKQAHLDLRYPKGYFAALDTPAVQIQTSLLEATHSPLEAASIHLTARIERVKPESIGISASIDIRQLQRTRHGNVQKGSMELLIVQQDAAGRVIGRENKTLNLDLTSERYAQLLNTGILFREIVEAKDSLATLRIVVADAGSAATGSLIVPVSQIK